MSYDTNNNGSSIFTRRAPGFLSQWDVATFEKAGLTPFDKLKARYGDNYTMLATEAEALRGQLDGDQWKIVVTKAEIGGRIKLAKQMTAHGGKGAVPRDFKASGDTALTWERLYDNMPWAYDDIRKEAADALANGNDYIYSLDKLIKVGEANAIKAGAKRVRPKYTGTGKVFVYDSTTRTGTYADLPSPFPGTKRVAKDKVAPPYWEPIEGYAIGPAKLWKEVVPQGDTTATKPYFTLNLTTAGKDGGAVETVPFRERVMVALIDRKDTVLELKFTSDPILLCNFDAREPQAVQVIDIDPTTGKVERKPMKDDDFTGEPPESFTPLSGLFHGLSLVQTEPNDDYKFTLAGQTFAGRSYIVRLGDSTAVGRWLAPLDSPLSAGDVNQHVSFETFDAVSKAKGKEPTANPNAGFEVLDAVKWLDYFGMSSDLEVYPFLHREFDVAYRYAADREAQQRGVMGVLAGKTAWHVEKLREIVNRQKLAIAAEATLAEAKAAEEEAKAGEAVVTEPVTETTEPVDVVPEPVTEPVDVVTEPVTEPVDVFTEPVTEPVNVVTEPETAETELLEPAYASLGYEERQLEDQKLAAEVGGMLDSIERRAQGILAAFNGEGRTFRDIRVQQVVDDVRLIAGTAREAHAPLDTLVDHIGIIKSEATYDPLAAVKRDIVRLAPHLDLKIVEILACYVKTPTGTVTVFNGEDKTVQPTA
jgi:hypothetical protein